MAMTANLFKFLLAVLAALVVLPVDVLTFMYDLLSYRGAVFSRTQRLLGRAGECFDAATEPAR